MRLFFCGCALITVLVGCSSNPPASGKPEQKPASQPAAEANKADTGRVAFQRMYVAARGWARDASPVGLESQATKDFNGKDGKSGVWRGTFGSASRQGMKPFTWSGVSSGCACSIRAPMPEATAVAILVPFMRNRLPERL